MGNGKSKGSTTTASSSSSNPARKSVSSPKIQTPPVTTSTTGSSAGSSAAGSSSISKTGTSPSLLSGKPDTTATTPATNSGQPASSNKVAAATPASNEKNSGKPSKKDSSMLKKQDSDKNFSLKRLEEMFGKYKEPEEDVIGVDGLTKFSADLGVDAADVMLLIISYHLNAQTMTWTKDEFIKGLQKMGVDSISKLKAQFKTLYKELDDPVKFKEIYRFSFNFTKEPDQKILDLQMGISLLELIMANKAHTKNFVSFLKQQTSYRALNLDQWMNFLEFSRSIKEDFSNYDENSAWPVLIDEYAAWYKAQRAAGAI